MRGVSLDVFECEPLPGDSPLYASERVVVTPHMAARTLPQEARDSFLLNLAALEQGREPPYLVNLEQGY